MFLVESPFFLSFFFVVVLRCSFHFYLNGRVTERERETQREIFSLLVYCPVVAAMTRAAGPKPGARCFFRVCSMSP